MISRPEGVRHGQTQGTIKRLVLGAPPWVKAFPYRDHPESDVHAVIVVEALNPKQQFAIKCSDLLAMHKAEVAS